MKNKKLIDQYLVKHNDITNNIFNSLYSIKDKFNNNKEYLVFLNDICNCDGYNLKYDNEDKNNIVNYIKELKELEESNPLIEDLYNNNEEVREYMEEDSNFSLFDWSNTLTNIFDQIYEDIKK
jgi:uncharacterized membrane-anchored protein YjiN (DUF445 family)